MYKKFFIVLVSSILIAGCGSKEKCGNGILDVNEQCDGFDFGSATCSNIEGASEYAGGPLACTNSCTMDTSECDPCWQYPCEDQGTEEGSVIKNYSFTPGNSSAKTMAGSDNIFRMDDLYRLSESKNQNLKLLVVFGTTGWCFYCKLEADILNTAFIEYQSQGVMLLGVVVQDGNGLSADGDYAEYYGDFYNWDFPSVAGDLDYSLWPNSAGGIGYPFHLVIDLNTMRILERKMGMHNLTRMRELIENHLTSTP